MGGVEIKNIYKHLCINNHPVVYRSLPFLLDEPDPRYIWNYYYY